MDLHYPIPGMLPALSPNTHMYVIVEELSHSHMQIGVCVWQEGLGKVGRSKLENQDKFLKDYLKYNH